MPQSILDSFLSGVSRSIKPDTAAGETRLGGVGDALKSAVVGALQLTPEGRAIRERSVHEETQQNMRNQQLRVTLAAKDPFLLLLPEMARAFDGALGKGAADMALVKYAQDKHLQEINQARFFGQPITTTTPNVPTPSGGVPAFGDAERMAGGPATRATTTTAPAPKLQPGTSVSGIKLPGGLKGTVSGPSRTEAKTEAFDTAFTDAYQRALTSLVPEGRPVTRADIATAMDAALGDVIARDPTSVPQNFMERANVLLGFAGEKAAQTSAAGEAARRGVRVAQPLSPEEDAAARARSAGLTGPAALDFKQKIREQFAAGRAGATEAGKRGAQIEVPMSAQEQAAAEAQARGLQLGTPDANEFVSNFFSKMEQRKARGREQVKEEFRRPSAQTQKTLTDIGIVDSIVNRMEAALRDPTIGPEIIDSRGVVSGRLTSKLRRFGFDVGEGKNIFDILTAQAEIIGVQPYLRGVRRYEFIQDARAHLPQPGDELPLIESKLGELRRLVRDYQDIAIFYDRPLAAITTDVQANRLPRGIRQEDLPSLGQTQPPAPSINKRALAEKLAADVNAGKLSVEDARKQLDAVP